MRRDAETTGPPVVLGLSVLAERIPAATAALSAGRREAGVMAEEVGKDNHFARMAENGTPATASARAFYPLSGCRETARRRTGNPVGLD
jgi:hypothetical protein